MLRDSGLRRKSKKRTQTNKPCSASPRAAHAHVADEHVCTARAECAQGSWKNGSSTEAPEARPPQVHQFWKQPQEVATRSRSLGLVCHGTTSTQGQRSSIPEESKKWTPANVADHPDLARRGQLQKEEVSQRQEQKKHEEVDATQGTATQRVQ